MDRAELTDSSASPPAVAPPARRDRFELAVAAAIFVLGIAVAWSAWDMGLTHFKKPGPGLFPFLIGIALAVLAAALALGGRASTEPALSPTEPSALAPIPAAPGGRLRELAVYFALVFYALSLTYVGFAASSLLFVIFLLRFVGRKSWLYAAVVSLAVVAPCMILFVYVLKMQLPRGALF